LSKLLWRGDEDRTDRTGDGVVGWGGVFLFLCLCLSTARCNMRAATVLSWALHRGGSPVGLHGTTPLCILRSVGYRYQTQGYLAFYLAHLAFSLFLHNPSDPLSEAGTQPRTKLTFPEWTSPAQPPAPSWLRVLYAGRVLSDDSTLACES
jgi:hypothetical protein